MTTKNSKKTTAAKLVRPIKVVETTPAGPTLAELVNGTAPVVAKAVAEKKAKTMAEKPLEPAPAKKTAAKKGNAKADKKAAKADKAPRETSGALIKQMILEGVDAETILKAVHKAFPDSKATKGDVSWNRWDLKRKGLLTE